MVIVTDFNIFDVPGFALVFCVSKIDSFFKQVCLKQPTLDSISV